MKQWTSWVVLAAVLAVGSAFAQGEAAPAAPAADHVGSAPAELPAQPMVHEAVAPPAQPEAAPAAAPEAVVPVEAHPVDPHAAPAVDPHAGHQAAPHAAPEVHGAEHGAAPAHGGGHGGHDEACVGGEAGKGCNTADKVAAHILHHVADDTEWSLELPFLYPDTAPTIDLGHVFGALLIERTPGACALPVDRAMEPFPSLGKWMNGCWDLRPTKALLMIWVAMGVLALLLILGRSRDPNGVPQGVLAHVIESLLLFVRDDIAVANIGKEEGPKYTPYLASVFFFIMCIDYLGLFPGMFTGTGVLGVTIAMALLTFVLVQLAGIKSAGLGGYLAHLFGDVPGWMKPLMFVVEFIGLFTKPFALLVRLFANMLAGHMVLFFLLSLIFVWSVYASVLSVPMAAAIYVLELFVAILQAYIFTLLTALFIGQGVAMGHHGAHGHDDHGHGHEHGEKHAH